MVNIAYNIQGLQNIGFTFSMLPGLRELYPDPHDFALSCRRYAVFHNCHPFWGPFITGAFLHNEVRIANGKIAPAFIESIKSTTLNSLSAIGDSFHSGSLDTAYFLLFVVLCANNCVMAACYALLCWCLLALLIKVITFYIGLRRGLSTVVLLKYFNLINIGDYIKIFNAFVLLFFLIHSLQVHSIINMEDSEPMNVLQYWVLPVGLLIVFSWLSMKLHYARIILLFLFLVVFS
jgi:PTS system mannose-specific IID component